MINAFSSYGKIASPIGMIRIFSVDIPAEQNDIEFVSNFDENAYKAADLIQLRMPQSIRPAYQLRLIFLFLDEIPTFRPTQSGIINFS